MAARDRRVRGGLVVALASLALGVLPFVLCAVLLVGAAPASAALTFPFDGQLAPAGGSFGNIRTGSVAVDDANGNTYVADSHSGVVDVFNSSGAELPQLDGALTPAGSFGERVAVAANNGTGDVYVLDEGNKVIDVFDSSGGYVCQITGSATPSATECNGVAGSKTPAGGFRELRGVAVDQATGDIYVVDGSNAEPESSVVDVFSREGAYLRQILLSSVPGGIETYKAYELSNVAVDDFNGHVYVADGSGGGVYEFGVAGEWVATWNGSNTSVGSFAAETSVAADDATGDVYVTDEGHRVVDVFEASGVYLPQSSGSFGAFHNPQGVAVDQASGKVYVADNEVKSQTSPGVVDILGPALVVPDVATGSAGEVHPTSAKLEGTVNPDGLELKSCRFEYGTEASYGQSAPCVPAAGSIPADSSVHAVSASVTGLTPGGTYHFRLVASNANGQNTGQDVVFSTPPPPSISDASTTNVTDISADLTAQIDPNGFETTYRFEWGTSTAYGNSVPGGQVLRGTSGVSVGTHLSGLSVNTTYHWRVVAQNENGTTTGLDHTFVYSTVGAGLPDNRAYEMVTPVQKNAALIGDMFSGNATPLISEDGSRVIARSDQCFAESGSCNAERNGDVGDPFAFTRTADGWTASVLAPPATQFAVNSSALASADADTVLFNLPTPPLGEDGYYARQPDGSLFDVGLESPPASGLVGNGFVGSTVATADLSHVVSEVRPVSGDLWSFDATERSQLPFQKYEPKSLYEYVGVGAAAPMLVGVTGGSGSTDLISKCGTVLGSGSGAQFNALSADGGTVFFTAYGGELGGCSGSGTNEDIAVPADALYARVDESRTVPISVRSPLGCTSVACLGSSPAAALFQGASEDGSKVFFTDAQQLMDGASEGSRNLYEYDFANPAGGNLVTVAAGGVQGVTAISPDGSHIYFLDGEVLTGAPNAQGQTAQNGRENLYVFERDAAYPEGRVAFIATDPGLGVDVVEGVPGVGEANVTPDGRFLVFTSGARLTADDTSVSGAAQVFRYDAQTGVLVRISIGEGGFNDNGDGGTGEATIVPAKTGWVERAGAARSDPTMSNDGAYVFFQSPVALTPHALNDVAIGTFLGQTNQQRFGQNGTPIYAQNVYEYHEGHVYLISDGRDTTGTTNEACEGVPSSVCLLGTDATGSNVFFMTADPLVAADTDTGLDIYDARVCTASEPCVASPVPAAVCQGEACHGAPAGAPSAVSAATVTFSGPGNLALPTAVVVHKKAVVKKHVKRKRTRKASKKSRVRVRGAARRNSGKRGGRS